MKSPAKTSTYKKLGSLYRNVFEGVLVTGPSNRHYLGSTRESEYETCKEGWTPTREEKLQ